MQSQRLRLEGVEFAFGPTPILHNVNLLLEPGWTGLVGANGCGKTTLLQLLHGTLSPDNGAIHRSGLASHYCPQSVDSLGKETESFAWSWERPAIRLRASFGLEVEDLTRWSTLSPGERKRWQIATALHAEPDILLLDEPSNHLDRSARAQLLDALRAYRGVGILVSHDRGLLDAITQTTLFVSSGRVERRVGNYSTARVERDRAEQLVLDSHARERESERVAKRRLVKAREQQAAAQAMRSSAKRMKDRRDSDARSAAAKARASNGEASRSRRVALAGRKAAHASARRAAIHVRKKRGRSLFVDYEPAPVSTLALHDSDDLVVGGRLLATGTRVQLRRESRVRLSGANGAGKTTLLQALVRAAGSRQEHLLYVPQDPAPPGSFEVEPAVCNVLAALGVDPLRLRASEAPSPGEVRKFLLAQGLARGVWGILLDEPTNHLDLPSIERLKAALIDYPGALIIVTHDDEFADALTNETWLVEDGKLHVFSQPGAKTGIHESARGNS